MSDIDVTPSNITTPNLGLNKPAVGGDDDIWGGLLNANADTLDSAVTDLRTEVGQLSGALLFIGTYDVAADYAEFAAASGFPNGPLPPASAANFNSYLIATTAATGHGNAPAVAFNKGDWLVSDGVEWVHLALGTPPGGAIAASTVTVTPAVLGATNVQSALQQLDQTQANLLPLAGGQMTGAVTTTLGNASAPALQVGDRTAGFWALGNAMFVNAGSVTVMQLQAAAITADVPLDMGGHLVRNVNAPISGMDLANKQYVDTAVAGGPSAGNVGRNLLHNPLFNVAQRGAGPFTVQGYTLDRWQALVSLDTVSIVAAAFSDAQRAAIGDEAAIQALYNTFAGNAGAASFNFISQRIERVRRLGGKTVTVSFWAFAASGTPKLGVSIEQIFGTGGAPSAAVLGNGQAVTISTTPTRYTLTFNIPSTSGKTLGINNDDFTQLCVWYSSGTNNATRAGSIGVQSGSVGIWGIQLEIGSAATPLEKPDASYDLANCQRFYQGGNMSLQGYGATNATLAIGNAFPVTMRATPTMVPTFSTASNATGQALGPLNNAYFQYFATVVATGEMLLGGAFTASADL